MGNPNWIRTISVVRRQETQQARIGVSPARVLHVVAVTRVRAELARLAREIHLERTALSEK
jgi:hypothetical protein